MVCILYSNVKRHLLCSYLLPIKTQPQTVCRGADVGNQQVPSPSPYLAFVQNMHFGRKRGLNLHIVSSAQFTLFVPRMVSHPKPSGRWYLPPCPRLPGCAVCCVGMMTGPALLPCLHCAGTQCQGRASSCFDSPSPSLHRLMAIVYESSGDQWRGWPQMWSHDNGHVFQDILRWVAAPLRAPETVSPSQLFGKLDLFTCSKLPFKQLHRLCCTSNNLI